VRDGDSKAEPIESLMRDIHGSTALKVPLTAAATVELTSITFLHGWMNHRSQQSSHKEYQLVARARQFSSFLLVIPRISSFKFWERLGMFPWRTFNERSIFNAIFH
jgi:hypothetical protein